MAHHPGADVETRAAHRAGHETLEPRPVWIVCLRRGDAEPERWLHREEGHHGGRDAERQRRQQRRARKPTLRDEQHEHQGESGADQIMGRPPDRALAGFPGTGRDAGVDDRSSRYVQNPSPEQAVVERSDPEDAPQEHGPQIEQQSRPESNENRGDDGHCRRNAWRSKRGAAGGGITHQSTRYAMIPGNAAEKTDTNTYNARTAFGVQPTNWARPPQTPPIHRS